MDADVAPTFRGIEHLSSTLSLSSLPLSLPLFRPSLLSLSLYLSPHSFDTIFQIILSSMHAGIEVVVSVVSLVLWLLRRNCLVLMQGTSSIRISGQLGLPPSPRTAGEDPGQMFASRAMLVSPSDVSVAQVAAGFEHALILAGELSFCVFIGKAGCRGVLIRTSPHPLFR